MANDDAIKKIKEDNVLLQQHRCGCCQKSLAQVKDFNATNIPGKAVANTDYPAVGAQCDECAKSPMYSKEGPRQALYVDANGDVRIVYYDTLVDYKGGAAATTTSTLSEPKAEEDDEGS